MSARRVLWTLVAFALGVAFIPLRSLDCPAWDVWATDQSGQPVRGVTVRLTYRNYSAERESHEIDAITDVQGHVAFRAQTLSASLGRRIAAMLLSGMAGAHASFGPHASVSAFGNGLRGFDIDKDRKVVVDWTGKPPHMESRIIVRPLQLHTPTVGYTYDNNTAVPYSTGRFT
jgi:hypothetical protein